MSRPEPVMPPRPRSAATMPECHDDVCVTCSDAAVPVTVLRLLDDELAKVRAGDHTEVVSVALVTAAVGDTILVHAREAIAVLAEPAPDTPGLDSADLDRADLDRADLDRADLDMAEADKDVSSP